MKFEFFCLDDCTRIELQDYELFRIPGTDFEICTHVMSSRCIFVDMYDGNRFLGSICIDFERFCNVVG